MSKINGSFGIWERIRRGGTNEETLEQKACEDVRYWIDPWSASGPRSHLIIIHCDVLILPNNPLDSIIVLPSYNLLI